MTWVIWDKAIDSDLRRDIRDALGIELDAALHLNGTHYIAKVEKVTKDQMAAIRGVYQRSVRFRSSLQEVKRKENG